MNRARVYWIVILLTFSCSFSLAAPLASKPSYPAVYCSIKDLKIDNTLLQKVTISDDPAGLSIQPKGDVDVGLALQGYANDHQCTLNALSMMALVKGLFKGSEDLFSHNDQSTGNTSQTSQMAQKYILIEGDTAVCIKKLDLKLPVKQFVPVKIKFCVLESLNKDKELKKQLTFTPDKIGLAFIANNSNANVSGLLQQYATKHQCTLYSISMADLVKGLIKGSDNNAISQQTSPMDASSGQQKKYLLIAGDKAICMKKLRLKLPMKMYLPKQ